MMKFLRKVKGLSPQGARRAEPRQLYPLRLPPVIAATAPEGTGAFDHDSYREINSARLAHLEALGLGLEKKSVLDLGCGVGHLADYFAAKGCDLTCVDGREENIAALRQRCPERKAVVMDAEKDDLGRLGRFEIVFCYGLLYHLENPLAALRRMAEVCKELLLLETIVTDHEEPVMKIESEPPSCSQALRGLACRPSPSFVVMALLHFGLQSVYAPNFAPAHPQFNFSWKNDLASVRDGQNLRCIFIASRKPLANPNLSLLAKAEV